MQSIVVVSIIAIIKITGVALILHPHTNCLGGQSKTQTLPQYLQQSLGGKPSQFQRRKRAAFQFNSSRSNPLLPIQTFRHTIKNRAPSNLNISEKAEYITRYFETNINESGDLSTTVYLKWNNKSALGQNFKILLHKNILFLLLLVLVEYILGT